MTYILAPTELIPLYEAEPVTAERKPKALQQKDKTNEGASGTKTLDQFAFKPKTHVPDENGDDDGGEEIADEDVLMNEDGTMSIGAS